MRIICYLNSGVRIAVTALRGDMHWIYTIGRPFSPSASACCHSGQRYSNSEWLSESTSHWIMRAVRKGVALLHLAQLTYVSEMAVRRVPRTSSCMTDTCLSFLYLWSRTIGINYNEASLHYFYLQIWNSCR